MTRHGDATDPDVHDGLDRLESLVEAQQETIQEQRERIAELEADGTASADEVADTTAGGDGRDSGGDALPVRRRGLLQTGGLLALLVGGVGTASADPQGQVGTGSDPLTVLYAEELDGGVTGDRALTDLVGTDLAIDGNGRLTATAARLDVDDGTTTVTNVEGITFGAGLAVADDGDGTVTIDR